MAKKKLNQHLYQDSGSGIWYFQKKVRGLDKPYKFSLETTSVIEARKKRDEYLLEIKVNGKIDQKEKEVLEPVKDILLGEIAIQWSNIKQSKVSKSTMEEYRKTMNTYVLPKFGNQPLSSITALDIELFISELECGGKTKINIMTPFKDIMRFSAKHKFIDVNPMDDIDNIKKEASEVHPLNLGEIRVFLENVPEFYKPLFMFLFFTGVRFGEAAALKWHRVDLENRKVHICKTLVRGEYKEPKTKSSIRVLKLSPITIEALELQKKYTFGKSEFVFLNQVGSNIHPHTINFHVFKPTLIKAGLSSGRSCKDTRSSYITNCLDNNERMGFVQKQVGHSTTKMIVEHYYKHIPAPDDGEGLDRAFVNTMEKANLIQENKE